MALLDKLMAAFKPAQEPMNVQEPVIEHPKEVITPDPAVLADMVSQLEAFVYDPELASELAPAFVNMSAIEGFDKVMELFAAKEKQIEALNVGSKEQVSTPAVQEKPVEGESKQMSATDILRERQQSSKTQPK